MITGSVVVVSVDGRIDVDDGELASTIQHLFFNDRLAQWVLIYNMAFNLAH